MTIQSKIRNDTVKAKSENSVSIIKHVAAMIGAWWISLYLYHFCCFQAKIATLIRITSVTKTVVSVKYIMLGIM